MEEDKLKRLIVSSANSYELVQKLKRLKNGGSYSIRTECSSIPIGKLMYIIIDRSKNGYKYHQIAEEILDM